MKTEDKKIIMYDSPEAATYRTDIEGWVSSDGRFYGKGADGERMARYAGSTHHRCDCGGIAERSYTVCPDCLRKNRIKRYNDLPFKEYDGSCVFTWDGDTFFWSEDEIIEYLEGNEEESIDLLFGSPNYYQKVDYDYWCDEMPNDSDGELPKELEEALENLNKVIGGLSPISYSPGKIRTTYTLPKE